MSKEFLKHVFDAFEREETSTKSGIQGTGLGMSITKKMVELMGGDISVESEKDKGSEFTVTLDLKLQHNVKQVPIQELKNLRALIVDDDFNTCESVTTMLKQMGMRSEWTTSPREAVFRAGRALDDDPFSAYIVDWLMPDQNGHGLRLFRHRTGSKSCGRYDFLHEAAFHERFEKCFVAGDKRARRKFKRPRRFVFCGLQRQARFARRGY